MVRRNTGLIQDRNGTVEHMREGIASSRNLYNEMNPDNLIDHKDNSNGLIDE